MEGSVKWFDRTKGFGFITVEDGDDIFVHHSELEDGFIPDDGDEVTFEIAETPKGNQARNVKKA